jgi:arginyl-tRNA synthetase
MFVTGYSVAEIIKASGKKVYKTQIINDREFIFANQCWHGRIWKWRNASLQVKGDKLVGNIMWLLIKRIKWK